MSRRARVQERAATHLRGVEARAGQRALRGRGQSGRRQVPLDIQQFSRNDPGAQGECVLCVGISAFFLFI